MAKKKGPKENTQNLPQIEVDLRKLPLLEASEGIEAIIVTSQMLAASKSLSEFVKETAGDNYVAVGILSKPATDNTVIIVVENPSMVNQLNQKKGVTILNSESSSPKEETSQSIVAQLEQLKGMRIKPIQAVLAMRDMNIKHNRNALNQEIKRWLNALGQDLRRWIGIVPDPLKEDLYELLDLERTVEFSCYIIASVRTHEFYQPENAFIFDVAFDDNQQKFTFKAAPLKDIYVKKKEFVSVLSLFPSSDPRAEEMAQGGHLFFANFSIKGFEETQCLFVRPHHNDYMSGYFKESDKTQTPVASETKENLAQDQRNLPSLYAKIRKVAEIQADKRLTEKDLTLLIVKPDAFLQKEEIKRYVESFLFSDGSFFKALSNTSSDVSNEIDFSFTKEQAQEFYRELKGAPCYDAQCDFMSSGMCSAIIFQYHSPVARKAFFALRSILGPSNVDLRAPWSIRKQFGTGEMRNAVHASDSIESLRSEVNFLFRVLPEEKSIELACRIADSVCRFPSSSYIDVLPENEACPEILRCTPAKCFTQKEVELYQGDFYKISQLSESDEITFSPLLKEELNTLFAKHSKSNIGATRNLNRFIETFEFTKEEEQTWIDFQEKIYPVLKEMNIGYLFEVTDEQMAKAITQRFKDYYRHHATLREFYKKDLEEYFQHQNLNALLQQSITEAMRNSKFATISWHEYIRKIGWAFASTTLDFPCLRTALSLVRVQDMEKASQLLRQLKHEIERKFSVVDLLAEPIESRSAIHQKRKEKDEEKEQKILSGGDIETSVSVLTEDEQYKALLDLEQTELILIRVVYGSPSDPHQYKAAYTFHQKNNHYIYGARFDQSTGVFYLLSAPSKETSNDEGCEWEIASRCLFSIESIIDFDEEFFMGFCDYQKFGPFNFYRSELYKKDSFLYVPKHPRLERREGQTETKILANEN